MLITNFEVDVSVHNAGSCRGVRPYDVLNSPIRHKEITINNYTICCGPKASVQRGQQSAQPSAAPTQKNPSPHVHQYLTR